jgi:hypothetical protein
VIGSLRNEGIQDINGAMISLYPISIAPLAHPPTVDGEYGYGPSAGLRNPAEHVVLSGFPGRDTGVLLGEIIKNYRLADVGDQAIKRVSGYGVILLLHYVLHSYFQTSSDRQRTTAWSGSPEIGAREGNRFSSRTRYVVHFASEAEAHRFVRDKHKTHIKPETYSSTYMLTARILA